MPLLSARAHKEGSASAGADSISSTESIRLSNKRTDRVNNKDGAATRDIQRQSPGA